MDEIVKDFEFFFAYLDDIFVFGFTPKPLSTIPYTLH
jgi:hypothetical protein